MTKPAELAKWELIDGIARRYSISPEAVLEMDVSTLQGIAIVLLGEGGD